MAASGAHAGHGTATLSLGQDTPDGGRVLQSWTICACLLPRLRDLLGPVQHESYSTAAAVRRLGETVLAQPGTVQVE